MYGQRPPGPPPPPPPFQQGLLAPPHPIMQQGLLPIPPRAGYQPGQPIYQHAPPPPHAPVHQGPQSHGGMFKVGQPYLHQPPPYRGSGPLPYLHPSSNQSSQYATHLFQNPPPPPHPSHGQAQYRTLGPTGGQGLHHAQLPLPPPPPAPQSQPPPPPPYGSFLQPPLGDSHMPPMNPPPLPPLPSSPPPRPPSPPPLTSPLPCSGTLPVPVDPSYLPSISGSEKVKGSKFRRFDCADNVASANHTGDNATMSHDTVNCVGLTGSDMNSIVKDGYLDRRSSVICDSLPPPRPKNENIVQKIETLCRLIVETGPASEDMAREKEVGKPEFEFLIGGEPGSEAAIAHEYFTWMKNNRTSEVISSQIVKLKESPLRPTETLLYSLADSDMEMEDNINQFHKDKEVHHSVDGPNLEFAVIRDELTVKEQLATSGSGNSLLAAQGIRVGTYVAQHSEGGSPFRLLQDYSSDDSTDESEPCLDVVNPVTVGVGHSSLSIDPSDNMETNVGSESSYKDESKSRSLYQEALAFSPNRISTKAPEFSPVSKMNVESIAESSVPSPVAFKQDEQHDGGRQLINHFASQDSFQKEDDTLDDVNLNDVPDHCNMNSKDAKCSSPQLKIDEFGRLVRQEESGSGSDDFLHTRRRGKRGRSRSRSLSPRDKRRRSPRRRRRSPSRSRSPRKRSRSRSPINRRIADHGGEKLKRGRGQIPDCLDFRRGKCHRGASCRFLHPMSDTTAESKRYKSRHKHGEASPNLNHKEVQGDSNIIDYDNVDAKKGYMQSVNSDNDGLLLGTDVDFLVPSKPVSDAGTLEMPEDTAEAVLSGVGMFEKADRQPQLVDGVSVSDSSHDQTSVAFAGNFLLTKPSTTELHHSANSMGQPFSENSSSQLPPLFSPPLPQSANVPSKPQLSTAYDFLQPTQSTLFQSAPGVNIPAYQVSIPGQQHHTSLPPNPTSTSLPPPPPPPPAVNPLVGNGAVAIPTFPYTQQSQPPINDFPSQTFFRPHLSTLPNHSYDGGHLPVQEHHHSYDGGHLPVQEHHRVPLPGGNSLQPFADANHTNFPSSSYAQGNVHTQALPPNEIYKASYGNHHFSHHQPQPYGLQYSAPHETLPRNTVSSATRFLSDILEKNQISRLPDFVESKIPTHYNPYASTFDQPLSSKFSSSSFIQEKEAPSGFSHLPGDGLGAGSIGSRQMSSSNSARVDPQNLPISGGDQYDPLFDSIDKSPKLLEKYDSVQKWDCIDEFGETADAEVGAVENGSPRSSPIDMENASTGEIEIDQIKSPGKRKKNKDSKSMKLFRIAVANFVKEVLKPSWRQGNMSKEAFKTIVKKTVDKVSGALKGNQIPKSQAKINQYIDSSQRKLTKLVMGYVDKYVKA